MLGSEVSVGQAAIVCLISMAVILVVLPAALMLLDWVIRHTTMHWLVPESSNAKKSDKE